MLAHYHTEKNAPHRMHVLKRNADGTVDIGPENGPAIVTNCPVTADPVNGSCTLGEALVAAVADESPGLSEDLGEAPADTADVSKPAGGRAQAPKKSK